MSRTIAIWLSPEQVPLMQQIADLAEAHIVAVGSPVRGQTRPVAASLHADGVDDLRAMLMSADADLILVASPGGFGGGSRDDLEALVAADARGAQVATLEPIPATALDLASAGWTRQGPGGSPIDILRFCPLLRTSQSWRSAGDVLENFGHFRIMSMELWCTPQQGSLGSQIYAAFDLVCSAMGEPETVDAAYVAPSQGTGVHMLPGESLRDLHGDLTANLRFADGRAASVVASNQGGRWNRHMTVAGPGGRLRFFDDGFEWIGPGGQKVDESRAAGAKRGSPPANHAVNAMVDAISRLLDPAIPGPVPTDHASVLAMGQAALLSSRTGQSESPATIRRMAAVG